MIIINSIAPVFLLIALGWIFKRTGFFPEAFFKGLNRLVFWFALPALLISRIGVARFELAAISRIVLLLSAATILSLIFAWLVSRWLKLPAPKTGSFIQGAFRGNGAFIGLPVIVYSLEQFPDAESLATVVLAPLVILFNILSVLVLLHYGTNKKSPGASVIGFIFELIKNPLIIGGIIGLSLNFGGIKLPISLWRPLDALGNAALPLILISIGASLEFERLRGAASPTLIASLIKVGVAPAFGFLIAGLFGCNQTEKMIATLYIACPAAGMSYVMAEVMGNDGPLAARIVALSTLLSIITIPIVLAIGL
jgi:predicted permease